AAPAAARKGSAPEAPAARADLLAREASLRALLDLAKGGDFYLALDPDGKGLSLMCQGAVGRIWPVLGAARGKRRILFIPSGPAEPLQGRSWAGGHLDPQRQRNRPTLLVDSQGRRQGPEEDFVPQTPEEAIPAPPSYRIRFDGGLEVEIVSVGGSQGRLQRLLAKGRRRLQGLLTALGAGPAATVRLRLSLSPDDAASLYRAFPEGSSFVVAGEGDAPGAQARLR
ncbi:MAG TPA: hypothetical protein VNI57_06910, partial [Candidatus Saccharimonadales bacterium]|nr:hypothetical protein [Candidatus Saccharimonadales bacterium]